MNEIIKEMLSAGTHFIIKDETEKITIEVNPPMIMGISATSDRFPDPKKIE